jgi:hypothetical protein
MSISEDVNCHARDTIDYQVLSWYTDGMKKPTVFIELIVTPEALIYTREDDAP